MSDGKTILVDVSRCTGCRGCQVACKQWNELPATDTVQTGSYQNPPDMNGHSFKIVRFREGRHENGKPYWNFFPDMCRHCVNPPCVLAADEGTMIHDEATGAVVYTEKTAENDFDVLLDACPYRIPRKNEKTGAIVKCTMCIDRISAGGIPACVQSCPTGAMRFGERAAMLELAHKRVEELKKEFPKAHAVDPDDVRVIYVITDDPDKYAEHVGAERTESEGREMMRALPAPAEALPQAPPGGMIPPGPPRIFMLHLKSVPVAGWMNLTDFLMVLH